jgi:hypothetical protein
MAEKVRFRSIRPEYPLAAAPPISIGAPNPPLKSITSQFADDNSCIVPPQAST